MPKRLTEEEYDKKISVHGKAERIDPYVNNSTLIKHRCLLHNQIYLAKPSHVLAGHGLSCCRKNPESKKKAKETYDEKLAIIGRVVRVGDYINSNHKILHKCLEHGEVHLALPRVMLSGKGLACCKESKKLNNKTKAEYDERLKILGQAERLEPYVNLYTKILHRCLIHGNMYLVTPSSVLEGFGLECCHVKKIKSRQVKDRYQKILKKRGRVKLTGEYVNMNTKVEHLCLIHNEVHLATPHNVIRGKGLICCRGFKGSTLKDLLVHSDNSEDSCVYLYKLSNYSGHLKLGISNQLHRRSLDPEYGEFISSWHTNSRLEAYCVEQASLRDCLLPFSCPEKLRSINWPGYTEIILCSEQTAIDVVQFYWDLVQELGPYQFILNYLNPTEDERKICLKALSAPRPPQTVLQ